MRSNLNPFASVTSKKSEVKTFTISALFTENNPHGYFSREQLIDYVGDMPKPQQDRVLLFLDYLSNGYPITNLPIPTVDHYGNNILWVKFVLPQASQTFMMKHADWLVTLVKDYTAGKLRGFRFTPEVLAEELNKASK